MKNAESLQFYDEQALEAGLVPKTPKTENDPENQRLLKKLQHFYLSGKAYQRHQPEIYLPSGEWREHVNHRMPFYQAFSEGSTDNLDALLSNFWRNELGVLVKQYAGYQQLQDDVERRKAYVELMAYDLMIWRNLFGVDFSELEIPDVGNPWGYLWEGTLIGSKVLRYHTLVTQITELVSDLNRPVVAEIGAGYCGMAYYLMKGNDKRVYIDFDLPETLAVGAYYLSKTLPHRKIFLHDGGEVDWQKVLREYEIVMMPNWAIDSLPALSVDVFLNTFSLSEMSYPVIEQYLKKISVACRHYFLHNNMDRPGVFNAGFERTPASQYPFPSNSFKSLYKRYDLFQQKHSGRDGDYREFLYQRISN